MTTATMSEKKLSANRANPYSLIVPSIPKRLSPALSSCLCLNRLFSASDAMPSRTSVSKVVSGQ